ncbi:MAG TPA: TonB-dependent receptor [Terracidiphilus sp.]|nr:TonB-dependent receptor [Terracidiphilus sp.]
MKKDETNVHLRIHGSIHCVIAAVLAAAVAASGQTPAATVETPAPQPQSGAAAAIATLHGHVADQTGALIPGAKITVMTADGKAIGSAKADSSGSYEIRGLKSGGYVVRAEYAGFAPFESPVIVVNSGQIKRVDISMAIAVEQQNVTVTDETPGVNVEAGGNVSAIVLKGKDLDALSDDPDELQSELTALAGPSAGPNGGQIYIDGFSGGQLPPKSAIREIRINQNPFSAEFDKLGYGRIEIFTKPGTDKLHGQAFIMGNDSSFNTGNPFTKTQPSYYSYQFNGTVSGAISKHASFFFSGERRHIGNDNTWLIPFAVLPDGSGTYTAVPNYGVASLNNRIRTNISARFDVQTGAKNTLTARYGFWSESEMGNLSAGSLPTASTHESNTEHEVQASDSFVINDHMVNETRFQFERQNENHYPDSAARTVTVMGDFSGGGYTGQVSRQHRVNLEFWNITSISHGPHAIKFGTRMRDSRYSDFTTSNYNGNFRFANYNDYLNMENGLAAGQSYNSLFAKGYAPIEGSYTTGPESAVANTYDAALFAEDDWKVNPRFTFSGGLRWEAQNHIADHNDWAPRISMAYALDGGKGKPSKTVLRAGFGIFYDRLPVNDLLTIQHLNVQDKIVLQTPQCSGTATSVETLNMTTCQNTGPAGGQAIPERYLVAPRYHSPYTEQVGIGLERQLTKTTNVSVTFLHSFGPHQLVTINANQINAQGDFPLNSTGGFDYEYDPEGVFNQNQVIASINSQLTKRFSIVGFYTGGWASSDGGAGTNISNAYNISQDYGPATFNSRNQIFAMGNYVGPWGLRFNPFLIANSGKPFNIVLQSDPVNNFYNQRPTYASAATLPGDAVSTPWGTMDSNPQPGETLIPANLGVGPAGVAVNLRVSRGFAFGPESSGPSGQQDGGGHFGGGGGGRRGGPPGGSLGPGGLSGGPGGMRGMFGGGASRKYNLTFSVQALNLFNDIDYGGPNGTIGSPDFLRSTTLAGGIFSSGSAARRIFLQATFAF